jgi:hypothetical protein
LSSAHDCVLLLLDIEQTCQQNGQSHRPHLTAATAACSHASVHACLDRPKQLHGTREDSHSALLSANQYTPPVQKQLSTRIRATGRSGLRRRRRGVTRCVQAATPQRTPAGKRVLRTAQL